jgi:hypothetical protein
MESFPPIFCEKEKKNMYAPMQREHNQKVHFVPSDGTKESPTSSVKAVVRSSCGANYSIVSIQLCDNAAISGVCK